MGFCGSIEYYTALDQAIGLGLTVDLTVYGLEDGPEVHFYPIPYDGLARLMMLRRSNAHFAYERTSQRLGHGGEPIDFRHRAQDLNTILFGRGPQDLVAILLDPELAPKAVFASLRAKEDKPEASDPETDKLVKRILAEEKVAEAIMCLVFELTTGMKHPSDPTREAPKRSDPTTPASAPETTTGENT